MKSTKVLSLVGCVLIFIGLLVALYTNHYSSKASVLLADRVSLRSIDFDSPETIGIKQNLKTATAWFYVGFICTGIGIICQFVVIVLEKKNL